MGEGTRCKMKEKCVWKSKLLTFGRHVVRRYEWSTLESEWQNA